MFGGNKLLWGLMGVAVVLIVIANVVPVLWPITVSAGGNVTAMTGTDAGTTTFKAFWPIVLLLVGLGLAIGLITYAMRKFNMSGKIGL